MSLGEVLQVEHHVGGELDRVEQCVRRAGDKPDREQHRVHTRGTHDATRHGGRPVRRIVSAWAATMLAASGAVVLGGRGEPSQDAGRGSAVQVPRRPVGAGRMLVGEPQNNGDRRRREQRHDDVG